MCCGFNRPSEPGCLRLHRARARRHQSGQRHHLHQRHQRAERVPWRVSITRRAIAPASSNIAEKLPGAINLRLLLSQRLKDETNLPGDLSPRRPSAPSPASGGAASLTSTYSVGPSRTTLTTRYLGAGTITNQLGDEPHRHRRQSQPCRSGVVFRARPELRHHHRQPEGARCSAWSRTCSIACPNRSRSSGTSFGTSAPYDLLGRSYRIGFRKRHFIVIIPIG